MKITITTGKGTGRTLLSSFDTALKDCGVANYNLIPLSSIIPPHAEIVTEKFSTPDAHYGYKLYVVKAEMRGDIPSTYIGAAVGWHQYGTDKRGLFVEHETNGASEEEVKNKLTADVKNSLGVLCENRDLPYDENQFQIQTSIMKVEKDPSSVLVIAVFQEESWR